MKLPQSTNERLTHIESGRGIAALAVLLLHAGSMTTPEQYSGKVGLNNIFGVGQYGVDFFFVLSGFILFRSCRLALGQPSKVPSYLQRRFFRIFPTYWFALALALFINQFQRERVSVDTGFIGQQLLMLSNPPWLGPAWTLQYELAFYTLIGIGLFKVRLAVAIGVLWLAAILTFPMIGLATAVPAGTFGLTSPYCLLFFLGIAAELNSRSRHGPVGAIGFAALGVLSLTLCQHVKDPMVSDLIFRLGVGLLLAATVCLAVEIESRGKQAPALWVYLGKISYSLYLTHITFIGITYAVLARLGLYKAMPEALCMALATLVSIGAAIIIHRVIEMPSIRLGQRLERGRGPVALRRPMAPHLTHD